MWFLIKFFIALFFALAGVSNFINMFYIKRAIPGFFLYLPFYIAAWAYIVITIRNEYKRDKELKAKEEQELKDR